MPRLVSLRGCVAGAAGAASVVLAAATPARAQAPAQRSIEVCASASEAAQSLHNERKLRAARDQLIVCSQPSCPAVVRRDCDDLLSQVDAAMPTLVLSLEDALGRDVIDARVRLDGAELPGLLEGRAIAVDPGPHTLRIERNGAAPLDQPFVVREGEKDRVLVVQLPGPSAPARGDTRAALPPAPPAGPAPSGVAVPWTAFAAAGVGVAALGAFGYLAVTGQSDYDRCAGPAGCPQGDVDALGQKRLFAWSALGVAVVASAVATWIFVHSGAAARPGALLRTGGAGVTF